MKSELKAADYGRVAVLMGGHSAEREISLLSGKAVLDALLRQGIDAIGIDADISLAGKLRENRVDRVFIALHGRDGEDGKVQGALEWMGLPYTGSGVLASALAMDKVRCKQIWFQMGISTPPYRVLDSNADPAEVLHALGACFIKPVNEGSSIGISSAETLAQLTNAMALAGRYDQAIMAERWVRGREYTVSILNGKVLPVIELVSANDFYDYEAKYTSEETRYLCPCDLDAEANATLQSLALQAHDAVGCSGWARVDAMRDQEGRFWLLEINTVPGMTSHSLVPMAAKAAGMDFDELVLQILQTSFHDVAATEHDHG
jgi:D-alanine-D-alanine ligase